MRHPDTALARHSRWSDPGSYAHLLDALPTDPAGWREIVGCLVLHPLAAEEHRKLGR